MKQYRIEIELGVLGFEIEAEDEDDAFEAAKEIALEDITYDVLEHAQINIEEIKNAKV
jgi:hypothetical protein